MAHPDKLTLPDKATSGQTHQGPRWSNPPRHEAGCALTHLDTRRNDPPRRVNPPGRASPTGHGAGWPAGCRYWLLVFGNDPHGEVLGTAAIGVAEGGACTVNLMLAGLTHHLQRRLGETNHPGRTYGV